MDRSKYYFFRDLEHDSNLEDDVSYHAFGVITDIYNLPNTDDKSGKDVCVKYYNNFKGTVCFEWRAYSEIEYFEVPEYQYNDSITVLNNIEQFLNV